MKSRKIMTQSEYARLKECHPTYISKLIRTNRLIVDKSCKPYRVVDCKENDYLLASMKERGPGRYPKSE